MLGKGSLDSVPARSLDSAMGGMGGRSRDVVMPQSIADEMPPRGRPQSATLAPLNHTRSSAQMNQSTGSRKTGRNKVTTYNENADNVEKEYIRNLQQQIYFLELESKFLRENKVSVGEIGGEKIEAGSVEEFLKQLKQKYNQMEAKYQDQIDDVTEERNKFEEKCYTQEQELKQLQMDVSGLKDNMQQLKEHDDRIASELRTEVVNLKKAVVAREDMINQLSAERDELSDEKEKIIRKHVDENHEAIRLKDQLDEAVALKLQAEKDYERERSNKIRMEATVEAQEDRLRQLEASHQALKLECQTAQKDKRLAEFEVKNARTELENITVLKDKLAKDLTDKTKEAHDLESKVQYLSKDADRAKELGGARVFERVIYRYMLGFMKLKVKAAIAKMDQAKQDLDDEINHNLHMKAEYKNVEDKLVLERKRHEATKDRYNEIDQKHTALEQNQCMLRDEIDSLKESLRDKEESVQQAFHRNYELEAQVQRMKHQIEMAQRVQALASRTEEFQALMETNLRVAKDIESLMDLGMVDTSVLHGSLEHQQQVMQSQTFENMESMRRKFYENKAADAEKQQMKAAAEGSLHMKAAGNATIASRRLSEMSKGSSAQKDLRAAFDRDAPERM